MPGDEWHSYDVASNIRQAPVISNPRCSNELEYYDNVSNICQARGGGNGNNSLFSNSFGGMQGGMQQQAPGGFGGNGGGGPGMMGGGQGLTRVHSSAQPETLLSLKPPNENYSR